MNSRVFALLVRDRPDMFHELESALDVFGLKILQVQTCKEAEFFLSKNPPPHLVLTDPFLSDGNWLSILNSAAIAPDVVNVIVVSAVPDIEFYMQIMNHGAFDFLTYFSTVPEIVHVVRSALSNARLRRGEQLPSDTAPTLPESLALS